MAQKELIPNDTPEIAKLKACKTRGDLLKAYFDIEGSKEHKHYSESYKWELFELYLKLQNELPYYEKRISKL